MTTSEEAATVDVSRLQPSAGTSAPLGAAPTAQGVNFSVYSKSASAVDLLLFEREEGVLPARIVSLDPVVDRTGFY